MEGTSMTEWTGPQSADEYYRLAMQPEFPNEMAFQITHENADPDKTFSKEGVEEIADKMHAFVMARIMGQWRKTGKAPKVMTAVLALEFDGRSDVREGDLPYFDIGVVGGLTQADGAHRIPRIKQKG
jgi:hypothetical protein